MSYHHEFTTTPSTEHVSAEMRTDIEKRMRAAEAEALRGCGSSDVLYYARTNEAYISILESFPDADRPAAEAILRENGFDPDSTPYEPGEGECRLTGIDIDCCPCGNHP